MRWFKKASRTMRRHFRMRTLDKHGMAILCRSSNGLLAVEAGDFAVGRTLLRKGSYDWDEILWLRSVTRNQRERLLIVGGHIGALATPLAESFNNVWVFEADPGNFELLSINLKLNGRINVQAFNQAVGSKEQQIGIARNKLNTGNSSVTDVNHSQTTVQMVRLDAVLPDQCIDLLVMDIEGYEPQAISGLGVLFDKVQKLYMEFAPNQLRAQGNDPAVFLQRLFAVFPHRYLFNKGIVTELHNEVLPAWLAQAIAKKDFLENVLFSRTPLQSIKAL